MIFVYVRNIETKNLAGIFWARNHDDLWWSVDQIGDPSDFEWCKANKRGGALMLVNEISTDLFRMDNPAFLEDIDRTLTVELDELASSALDDPKWTRFDFCNVGHGGIAQVMREQEQAEIIRKLGNDDSCLDDWK